MKLRLSKAARAIHRRRRSRDAALVEAARVRRGGRRQAGARRNPDLFDTIRPGDRVTIVNRFGQQQTGRATIINRRDDVVVLNLGGPHGTPGIATRENVVKVVPGKKGQRGGFIFNSQRQAGAPPRRNPAWERMAAGMRPPHSERAAWLRVMRIAEALKGRMKPIRDPDWKWLEELLRISSRMVSQLDHGIHENPMLGVIGNPPDWGRLRQQDLFTGQIDPVQVRASLGKAAWLGKAPGYVKEEVKKALARLTHDQFLSQVMGYRAHGTLGQRRFKPGGPKNNPSGDAVATLSSRVYELRYRHTEDGKDYKHTFGSGVRATVLRDGRVVLWHPAKSLWRDFPK